MANNNIEKDLSLLESVVLELQNQMGNVAEKQNDFWGDISKYTDEDFDYRVPRLKIPHQVTFKRPSQESETIMLAELMIQNTSNLPMTYNIVGSNIFQEFQLTKNPDWIPPHSETIIEIRTPECQSSNISNFWGSIPSLEYFVVCATPIFREEHTQQGKIDLYWKAFGSDLFPYFEAEEYMVIFHDEDFIPRSFIKPLNLAMSGIESIIPPKKVFENRNEFISLWAHGEDTHENNFFTEFRLRERTRVLKKVNGKGLAAEAEARANNRNLFWLFMMVSIFFLACILLVTIGVNQIDKKNADYDNYINQNMY